MPSIMAHVAVKHKEEGNEAFAAGNFSGAEALYSKAIQCDSTNPILFTNRAFARIKLQLWDLCIDDCRRAISLQDFNMKGYYYLAQAQLALNHPNEALSSALSAYELCLKMRSPSASSVVALVLQAKKQKWESRERERVRRRKDLLRECEDAVEHAKDLEVAKVLSRVQAGYMSEIEGDDERGELESATRLKEEELEYVFAISDPENLQRREVPDYLIDNISFNIMHDPVITKTGHSYERATILEHLRHSETDPLTREPLFVADLRPNLALRDACEEFLKGNGWAVDY